MTTRCRGVAMSPRWLLLRRLPPTIAEDSPHMTNAESADEANDALDNGMVRAGGAAAARRRELDISQRSLAADGIINAGALIAFEKGRSWPRERTRAKLEEVLRWPPGTIERLRHGDAAAAAEPETPSSNDELPLIAQAVVTA